ncbi:hypothetical protein ACXR6G_18365 [Ancylomarina sp. YFZ004]
METTIEYSENYHVFRYHLSLCTENIQELIRSHRSVITDMMEEDVELTLRELHIWCQSVQDRILIVQLACKSRRTCFFNELVDEAISLVENHHDCTYILKANVRNQFLSLQQTESLFNKANGWAEYTWEYLELAKLEHQSPLMIYEFEDALEKAAELANTSDDCCCMGEFYAKIGKESDKACLWYDKAMTLVEDDDDREAILCSIGRYFKDEAFKREMYEQLFDQAKDKSLRLKVFFLLKSKFWDEQKAGEKWADFCYEIMLVQDWQFLHQICDKFYRKGAKALRKYFEKMPLTEPKEALNILPYARFLKRLYCNKKKAEEWINKAFHLQIEKDSLDHQPFLTIAIAAWKELKDISLTHEIIKEAADRVENVEEYYQIFDTIRETTHDKLLMKAYCKTCLAKKYATHEYYRIVKFAVIVLEDMDLANRAVKQAMRHVSDYDAGMLIRQVIVDHDLDEKQADKCLILMHQLIGSCANAIDLAQILHDISEPKEVEQVLENALNLVKSTKDFSIMIRFVNFWLSNTKKAQFLLNRAIEKADKASDFQLLVQDAKLLYGLDWRKAF